MVKWTSITS